MIIRSDSLFMGTI